jgi:hypothetical protein
MIDALGGAFILWAVISMVFSIGRALADADRGGYWDSSPKKGRIKTNLNLIGLLMNIYDYVTGIDWKENLRPKTQIEKEIAEELKEIEQLEQQKAKMQELEQLRARKDRLFEEVEKKKTLHDIEWPKEKVWVYSPDDTERILNGHTMEYVAKPITAPKPPRKEN